MAVHRPPHLICLLAAGLILAGCKDTTIATYRVPKESRFVPPADIVKLAIRWQTPPDWQEQPGDGVRQGSFLITGTDGAKADVSVITFPGDVGGDLANVNRWRAQIQLPPVSEAELPGALVRLAGPAGEFLLVDLLSETPVLEGGHKARVLGAILKQPAQTWFFKLAGEADLVASQKEAFVGFLKSVEFSPEAAASPVAVPGRSANTNDLPPDARGVPATAPLAEGPLPAGHPSIDGTPPPPGMASTPVPTATGQALVWTAPAPWTPKPGSAMRKGSYAISGPEGAGDLSITAFPGDVGGNLANVNRWRGQLQLPPVTDLTGAVQPLEVNGLNLLVFDAANGGSRILGAIVPRPGETWFFKLTGPDALVAREKPAFLDFLRTVKAP
ncbi:MAG: hypothetical protein ABSG50_05290 [Opitutaceae bacterium]|jgi:hypothetical protein